MIMRGFCLGVIVLDLIVCLLRLFWLCDCVLKCLWRFFVFGRVCARELRLNLHFFGFFINTNRSNLCPSSWMLCLYLKMIMRGFPLGPIVSDLIVCLLRFLSFVWLKMNARKQTTVHKKHEIEKQFSCTSPLTCLICYHLCSCLICRKEWW